MVFRFLDLRKAAYATLVAIPLAASATDAHAALVISTGVTANVTCASHVCTATGSDAVFNVKRLQKQLANSKIKLVSGSVAGDIVIDAPLTWVSANTLTLDAYHSIIVNQPISLTGSGGLTLTTNDGGAGGVFSFGAQGDVTFWSLSDHLKINNKIYTLVNTVAALASDIVVNSKGHYALADNYDATPDGTYAATPIPTNFTGIFEGLGNTISNLTVNGNGTGNVGLFATVGSAGVVENLGLSNASAKNSGTGLLVGVLEGSLFGDHVSGSVVNNTVAGTAGGLVGFSFDGRISHSYSTAAVQCGERCLVGGLVGDVGGGVIDNSYATGTVTGGLNADVGGFAGFVEGAWIDQSYATAAVTGGAQGRVGGFVGENNFSSGMNGLTNDYATGAVSGGSDVKVGGFIGQNGSGTAVANSYATGAITGGGGNSVGGFVGNDLSTGAITESYWDTTSSGVTNLNQGAGNVSNDPGIAGLTTIQLQSGLPTGFDPSIWGENGTINSGLPYLLANPPPP